MAEVRVVRTIRAGLDDLEALAPLFDGYRRFYRQPSDPQAARAFLAERLKRNESVIFVAVLDGAIVGFTQLYPLFSSVSMKRLWLLNDLFVAPSARRTGAGRALLERAERWAKETGAKGLTLSTEVTNVTAQRVYEAAGWTKDDEFFHYHRFFEGAGSLRPRPRPAADLSSPAAVSLGKGARAMANPVTWFEIIGKDSIGLQRFYRDVFGWKLTPPVKELGNYSMLERPDTGIGGGFGEGDARVSVYVEVAEPQRFVDKAVAAGATLLMPVTTITPTTTIAMLTDPAGNTFGVLKAQPAQRKTTRRASAPKTARPRKKSTAARGRKSPARPKKRTRRSS